MRWMQNPASSHPPKPRLTVRVGITGHRPNKLTGAVIGRVQKQLPEIFAAIERAAASILTESAAVYADEPAVFRMISGFAEGADQIAVAACPSGWRVEATLPFPRAEYLKDFATSAAGDGRDVSNEFRKTKGAAHQFKDNSWFVGVAPRRNPEIVVCVLFEQGEHGYFAARAAAQVVKAYVDKQRLLRNNPMLFSDKVDPGSVPIAGVWTAPAANDENEALAEDEHLQGGTLLVKMDRRKTPSPKPASASHMRPIGAAAVN